MKKFLKGTGLLLFLIAGYLVGDYVFAKFIAPLQIGPSPIMSVVTVVIFMGVVVSIGFVLLKADDLL